MPGFVAAAVKRSHKRKHGKHDHGRAEKVRKFYRRDYYGAECDIHIRLHQAARTIQIAAMRYLIAPDIRLLRIGLLDRLALELQLKRGLRNLLLCAVLFSLVVYSTIVEKQNAKRLGLLHVYKSVFNLDDSLADIATIDDLQDYVGSVSRQSHSLQQLSSLYFFDSKGEVLLLPGVRDLDKPITLNLHSLKADIDVPEWSITAWVELDKEEGSYIIRKPLDVSKAETDLVCWGWFVGSPCDRLDYGAHDFRGDQSSFSPWMLQESVESKLSSSVPGSGLRYVALVVTHDVVEFWVDAKLQATQPLPRPVTDCSGNVFLLGGAGVSLGEITLYSRRLVEMDMTEILFAGFTLGSIAAGRSPLTLKRAAVDEIMMQSDDNAAAAAGERSSVATQIELESALVRVAVDLAAADQESKQESEPVLNVAAKQQCKQIPIFGDSTSCRVIDVWDPAVKDALTNKSFYHMLPSQVRPNNTSPTDRIVLDHLRPREYIRYDSATWPSFCNQSASFSLWLEAKSEEGAALLSRYSAADATGHSTLEWALYAEGYGLHIAGRRVKAGANLPISYGHPLSGMQSMTRRHLAYVLDVSADSASFYLDGKLLGSASLPPGTVASLDCDLTGDTAYTGLGHLAPGTRGLKGPLQDWRYYPGQVLSEKQVHQIAEDTAGPLRLRTCEHDSEGGDSTWRDLYGHDCEWYFHKRKQVPHICAPSRVRKKCPEACAVAKPCFQDHDPVATHTIFDRILKLQDAGGHKGNGVICGRAGLDLVELCRRPASNLSAAPGATGALIPADKSPYEEQFMDVDVRDCNMLQQVVDPLCSFRAADMLGPASHRQIKKTGGYTLEFWIKIQKKTRIPSDNADWSKHADSMRRILFFSRVSPPRVLATISLRSGLETLELQAFGNCFATNKARIALRFSESEPLRTGVWFKVVVVYGAKDKYGRLGIRLMQGSQHSFMFMEDIDWCEVDDDFIQAIQLPGGILVSPIVVTMKPLGLKILQERFYHEKPALSVRRGPAVSDAQRMRRKIQYDRSAYNHPAVLLSPPIVLQHRVDKDSTCSTLAGTDYLHASWNRTVWGAWCSSPWVCDDDLRQEATELLACKTNKKSDTFFGTHKLGPEYGELQGWFFEFLQTIAEASVLKRIDDRQHLSHHAEEIRSGNDTGKAQGDLAERRRGTASVAGGSKSGSKSGSDKSGAASAAGSSAPSQADVGLDSSLQDATLVYPSDFLDSQTQDVQIVMTGFSPDFGIATLIRILVRVDSEVEVDYTVDHYQAVDGDELRKFWLVTGFAIATSLLILVEKLATLWSNRQWRDSEVLSQDQGNIRVLGWSEMTLKFMVSNQTFLFDILLQVVLPITYFTIRLVQVNQSGYIVDHMVSTQGFAGIAWQDSEVTLQDKLYQFLSLVGFFEEQVFMEQRMMVFYFVIVSAQLFRLIAQTEAHPRTAILVKTLRAGRDDVLHFLLLCLLVLGGFILQGWAVFGSWRSDFQDLESSFRTLWEILLGNMLESGEIKSNSWTSDPMLFIFQMVYLMLVFMVLLNFIIAILVESYMLVKQEVEDMKDEQAFWTDCVDVMCIILKSHLFGWPRHAQALHHFRMTSSGVIDYALMRHLFPEWRDRKSMIAWLTHYGQYDFLTIDSTLRGAENDRRSEDRLAAHFTEELSLMLGVSKPTLFERIKEQKRLKNFGLRERQNRRDHALAYEDVTTISHLIRAPCLQVSEDGAAAASPSAAPDTPPLSARGLVLQQIQSDVSGMDRKFENLKLSENFTKCSLSPSMSNPEEVELQKDAVSGVKGAGTSIIHDSNSSTMLDGGASNSTTSNVKKDMNMFEHWSEGGASAGKAALVPNSVAEFVLCDTTHRTNNSPRWDGDGSDEKDKAQVQVVLSSIEKRKAGARRPLKALSWKQKSLGSNRWHLERISDVAVNVPPPCEPSTSLPPAKPPMSDGVTADHDRQEALEVDSPTVDKSLSSLSVYRLSASLSLLK